MKRPGMALMVLSFAMLFSVDGFAWLGYPVCAAGCMEAGAAICTASAAVVGPGAVACAAAAAATCLAGCVCFDEETTVETRSGIRTAVTVPMGEDVLTLVDGQAAWTKMRNKYRVHGGPMGFDFVTVHAPPHRLTVTQNHPVFANVSGHAAVREAGRLAIGDAVYFGADSSEAHGAVSAIANATRPSKIIFETEHGTILANGIWVKTALPEEILGNRGSAEPSDHVDMQKYVRVDVL